MKKIICLLLVLSIFLALTSCMPNLKKYAVRFANEKTEVSAADAENADYIAFLEKLEAFSVKLTSSVSEERGNGSNLCISPVSVYMALAIACEGSQGETRDEILNAVGVSYDEVKSFSKYLYAFCNEEFTYVNESGEEGASGYSQLSNSIWAAEWLSLNNSAVSSLASSYNCDVFAASYGDGTAQKMINQYIEYKTHGLVNGNLSFNANTAFAIINTFYLKEVWNTFGRNLPLTVDYYDFKNRDGSVASTQMLRGYYNEGVAYESEDFSSFYTETENGFKIHFIVPVGNKSISNVFNEENISLVLSLNGREGVDYQNMQLHLTRVIFPEFKASFSGSLNGILTDSFGIEKLFNAEECDLSLLTDKKGVCCQSIVHKCELKVDNEGIDGSAVTAIQGGSSVNPNEYEEIYHDYTVDRAFGFILTDSQGTVLFSGIINQID